MLCFKFLIVLAVLSGLECVHLNNASISCQLDQRDGPVDCYKDCVRFYQNLFQEKSDLRKDLNVSTDVLDHQLYCFNAVDELIRERNMSMVRLNAYTMEGMVKSDVELESMLSDLAEYHISIVAFGKEYHFHSVVYLIRSKTWRPDEVRSVAITGRSEQEFEGFLDFIDRTPCKYLGIFPEW